jgi:hypothetical protein
LIGIAREPKSTQVGAKDTGEKLDERERESGERGEAGLK